MKSTGGAQAEAVIALDCDDASPQMDWEECQSCMGGDHEACARLFKRHERVIAGQMRRFSRERHIWEELVQEVFVQVYFSLKRYRFREVPFEHWLRRIATRVGYQYWKTEARRRKHLMVELRECDSSKVVFGRRDQVAAAEPDEAAAAANMLHALLARLKAPDRLVLTLMYFDDCGTEQIADRTGWNRAVVKMRAMRARRRLKKIIEDEKLKEHLMLM